MTSIGIITFLHNENYGSTLQAWALQTVLRGAGWDAVHIDYAPDSREKLLNLVRSGNSPALVLDGIRKRRVKAGSEGARIKAASFAPFYQKHMKLTAPCRRKSALREAAKGFDLLLCGSDQIWSPVWLNPTYFLDFAEKKQPRIAYACSLGVSRCESARKMKRIAQLTDGFSAVSVREEEGAALLRKVCKGKVDVMPDPVCLPERADWLALAEAWPADKPYIACYFIGDRPDYWERVRKLREETGADVVVIPVTQNAYSQPYAMASGLSPEQWLGVLAGAAQVVTDSFHGAVFSLLLGRPLTVLRRYSENDPESKNSRIDNLFRRLGADGTGTVQPSEAIDAGLDAMRQEGRAWLFSALRQAER